MWLTGLLRHCTFTVFLPCRHLNILMSHIQHHSSNIKALAHGNKCISKVSYTIAKYPFISMYIIILEHSITWLRFTNVLSQLT